jgi:hypothetical protein
MVRQLNLRRFKNNFRLCPWLRINPAAPPGIFRQVLKECFSAHHFGPEISMV